MKLWNFIESKLRQGIDVNLLLVIESQGSSPGRKGFKMAVAQDGELMGSIGGGVMEYQLVERARKEFEKSNGIFCILQKHEAEGEDSSGMICSGQQRVVFYPLKASFLDILKEIKEGKNAQLVFNEKGIHIEKPTHEETIVSEDGWIYKDDIGKQNSLYVFGAGHVSVAVSQIFSQLGFKVIVFDNRNKDLSSFKDNYFAHEKKIIDYSKSAEFIPEGDHIYVVIMTFNHRNDLEVLELMLPKKIKYLGMMGSSKKVASIYQTLKEKGISADQFKHIDAPIGLPIKSQTPEEIAISIAAKVIEVKNK